MKSVTTDCGSAATARPLATMPTQAAPKPRLDDAAIAMYLALVSQSKSVANICVDLSLGGDRHSWSTGAAGDTPTQFQIGCVTKALVASIVLDLEYAGAVSINAPIGEYLSEFEGSALGKQVRIRDLLSDSAGHEGVSFFNDRIAEMTWDSLVATLIGAPRLFCPGTVCNLDFSNQILLGEVIRRTSGRSWMDLVDERVGLPLFGRSLYIEKDRQWLWAPVASHTMLSSAELATLAEVLMTGKSAVSSERILCNHTVQRLQQTVVRAPLLAGERCAHWLPVGFSLGIPLYHSGLRGECGKGKGQLSSIRFLPSMEMALAVCVGTGNPFVRHDVIDAILAELGIDLPVPVESVPMGVLKDDLPGEYLGLPGFKTIVDVQQERVRITVSADTGLRQDYLGSVRNDGTFSLDNGQRVAGLSIFADPGTGLPSLMLGVHALRKAN